MLLWRAVVGGWDCDVNRRQNGKNGKKEKKEKFHLHSYPSQIKYTFSIHECVYIILTQHRKLFFGCSIFLRLFWEAFYSLIHPRRLFGVRHNADVIVVDDVRIWKVIFCLAPKGFTKKTSRVDRELRQMSISLLLSLLPRTSSPSKKLTKKPRKSPSCLYINICVCLS